MFNVLMPFRDGVSTNALAASFTSEMKKVTDKSKLGSSKMEKRKATSALDEIMEVG